MTKRTNKKPCEHTILVSGGDQLFPTGNLVTNTTALNLANGQFGVLSEDSASSVRKQGVFLQAGDDSNEVQAISIVQGTPKSNATQTVSLFGEGDNAYVKSGIIRKNQILSVAVKKPTFGRWGGESLTGFPAPINDTKYSLWVNVDSTRIDGLYPYNDKSNYAEVGAINFTSAGIAQPKDYVLQNLATQLNSVSKALSVPGRITKREFVVLGVNIAGGSGQALGTITPTTNVTFDVRNGVNQVIQFPEAALTTLAELVRVDANLTNTSTIEVLNTATAGQTAKVDALIVLGLPHTPAAAFDDRNQLMVTVKTEVGRTFYSTSTDPITTHVGALEADNSGRMWLNEWRFRPGTMVHTMQVKPKGDFFLEGVNYINTNKNYTSYTVDFWELEQTLTTPEISQKKAVLLYPAEKLSTFTVTVANIGTRLAASQTPIPFVTSNDAGTGTASTNVVSQTEAIISAWLEHARTTGVGFPVIGDAVAGGVYLS